MAYVSPTKPTQGDATKKSLVDLLIDNGEDHEQRLLQIGTISGIKNGSFESGTSNVPSAWTWTAYTGGDKLLDTSDQRHGEQSFKVTSPGGAGNGGGYIETTDYFEVDPLLYYRVQWEMKSSAAGVNNKVEITWYTSALASISTSALYDSSSNPTSWTPLSRRVVPPATARFAKLRLTGCHTSSTTAGSTWFDNVLILTTQFDQKVEFTASGSWRAPTGIAFARITAIGGGGGGAPSGNGGGGGGGTGRSVTAVTAGTFYTVTIGAGGTSTNNGGNTTCNGVTGNGGVAGTAGSGGAGGTGTGDETWTGSAGTATGTNDGGFAKPDGMEIHQYGTGAMAATQSGNAGKVIIEY